jgi:DNA mismatch repair protein MutL
MKINVLDAFTANRIAAGEVVERPVSVVKELVENSVDAGATMISIEIEGGGIKKIRISDNGCGIDPEDCALAFERHATSKIKNPNDLDAISTLGFRGEALCSIAAVAQVELTSRVKGAEEGTRVCIHGGTILENSPFGCPEGTSILVENLFYNTPARLEFLKTPAREAGDIAAYVANAIMANPEIAFSFISDGKQIYKSPGRGDLLYTLFTVYGREIVNKIAHVDHEQDGIRVQGYVTYSEAARSNRSYQSFFVNRRYIQSAQLSAALSQAFGTRLPVGKFPLCALHIDLPADCVDVNIHPNKLQVRFKDNGAVINALKTAVELAIGEKYAYEWTPPPIPREENATLRAMQREYQYQIGELERPRPLKREDLATKQESRPLMPEIKPAEPLLDDSFIRTMVIPARAAKESYALRDSAGRLPKKEALFFDPNTDSFRILGQIFGTYIAVELKNILYLIDQHAAHERILYDKLMRNEHRPLGSQRIIGAEQIMLTQLEYTMLIENEELVRNLGFDYELKKGERVNLLGVPLSFEAVNGTEFFRDVLDALADNRDIKDDERRRRAVATTACKHAIKGNEKLTETEISLILSQMNELRELHCPHGRPIVISITRRDLDKLFYRV